MSRLSLFRGLNEADLNDLVGCGEIVSYSKGKDIFKAGDKPEHVFILVSGSVKLVHHHILGRDRIVHIVMKNDLFGAAVAFKRSAYPITAVPLEDCNVFCVSAHLFREKFLSHEKIGKLLLSQMGERMQNAHENLIAIYDNVQKRILHFLLDLQIRSSHLHNMSQIAVPLTLQNIADAVGSSVETVIREMKKMKEDNLIHVENRHYSIPDTQKVKVFLES